MFVNQNILDQRNNFRNNYQDDIKNREIIHRLITNRNGRPRPDSQRNFSHDLDNDKVIRKDSYIKERKNNFQKRFKDIYSKTTGNKLHSESKEDELKEIAYYNRFYRFECINALYSIISIITSVAHYELSYYETEIDNKNKYSILLYFTFFISILLWLNIIFYELKLFNYKKKKEKHSIIGNLFTSGEYINLIINLIISLVHPNPIFEGEKYISYNKRIHKEIERSINSILTICILFRFYFIIRFIIFLTKWMDPKTDSICKNFSFKSNIIFSIKSLLNELPFLIYLTVGSISIFFFCFSIRVFERDLSEYYPTQDYNNIFNSIWYVIITMTTVGYGDYSVRTNEARVIAMSACIFGSFLISLLLLTLTNFLNFTRNELLLFRCLDRINLNEMNKNKAKSVLSNFCLMSFKNNFKNKIKNNDIKLKEFIHSINQYKETCNNIMNNDVEEMSSHPFSNLRDGITFMEKEYNKIIINDDNQNKQLLLLKEKLEKIYLKLCEDN